MQHGGVTNPVSPMHGSTSNPKNLLQTVVDDHSSHSENEYINLDDETGATNNTNGDTSGKDTENHNGEDEVQLKHKRQKTGKAWSDFKQVTLSDGTKKVECIHCKTRLAFNSTGTTTTWNRHMERCLKRKQYLRTQQLLNFQPIDVDIGLYKPLPFIAPDAKYDANKMREAIANWIMVTEQPFSTVDDEMFVYMMKTANPLFERISRPTTKADCFKVYENEKKKLKDLTNDVSNISLTTDCWRSSHQKIEYMAITGHFIDQNWRLQKHVLSFVHVPPPRTALDIADGIYKCLKEWEIEEKIFSISVDNASYNDKVVKTSKTNFSRVKKLPCDGRLFHVRCCAHILNLLVKEGLSHITYVIEEVREAVKYINYSEARRQTFSNVAHQLQIHDRKLMLDVPTRSNSTYDMLSLALNFKDVFPRYADYEPHFHHLPSDKDWDNVKAVFEVLKVFKVCTNIISGTDYPTANLYLMEV